MAKQAIHTRATVTATSHVGGDHERDQAELELGGS